MLPSLDVVIPAFNAERFLERAVASIFATGYPDLGVVIVDDGSTDGTRQLAEDLCSQWQGHCRLLRHPDGGNHGVSSSRNLGISASKREWVALLDADDFYLPNRFAAFQRKLADSEQFDALYEICEIRFDEAGQLPSPGVGHQRFGIEADLTGEALLGELLLGRCWATSAITIRRDLLVRTGLFDPGKCIAEDCDLWFRMAAVGRIVAGELERPVSVYWRHADNTYHYKPEHRVALVQAMMDSWSWAKRNGGSSNIIRVFGESVPVYVTRSIHAARESGQPGVAWRLLRLMLQERQFRFLLQGKVLRQGIGLSRDWIRRWIGLRTAGGYWRW